MNPPTTDPALLDYFHDAWTYGLCDFETPDCAFFKVNQVDREAFPELASVFAVKVADRQPLALYPTADAYVLAVSVEAGR